ncbi:MAG: YciC family protein [Bacteroidota bacterium]
MEINQNNENQNQMQLPEPTVSGTYGHGWEIMKKNFPELLLVMLIQVLLSLPVGFTRGLLFGSLMTTGFFQIVYGLLVLAPVSYGSSWVFLKAVRGETFKVQDIFFAYQSFGNVLLSQILVSLIVMAGIIMLIVPGIIFACKLAFVPFLVMDEKMEAAEAIRKSWNMTNGHAGTIFLMGLTAFFVGIGGLICFVVGIFPAIIWISLAFACIYHVVSVKAKEPVQQG